MSFVDLEEIKPAINFLQTQKVEPTWKYVRDVLFIVLFIRENLYWFQHLPLYYIIEPELLIS